MAVRDQPDFWAGLLFAGSGAAFALGALAYPLGRAARMGAGYFPLLLGLCLIGLGLSLAVSACRGGAARRRIARPGWRPLFLVLGSVCLFAASLQLLGIYLSVFFLAFVGSMADPDFDWRVAAAVGAGMTGFVWLVFVRGLGLVFPVGLLGAG
ncbi:tripartite tricarboxylate transporter TctB family protein [Castellaniella sp.]|uniref:tripartite tricarboxylate transporter TctB family protein n=1 Tax=Castellaniella sp. TaxID=1955812 RepID=UPI002AFFDCD7|nr:tripartite tricarboxylate transporter TctB family protein [Castellaniella sp.]